MQFGAEVCTQFINGCCAYGSRCKYFHPEKTCSLVNLTAMKQKHCDIKDSHPPSFSIVSSTAPRHHPPQCRLRPAYFTLKHHCRSNCVSENKLPILNNNITKESTAFTPVIFSLWVSCLTATVCSITFLSVYILERE
ncbi:unnamed protein product [Phytomonas sp. EM1]|nr:unnamed protein product [Phytomonas sp. EM1]|eukprot:CCW61115.1 unnamed protein product [Phytomonas sp. isolate EM1]